MSQPNQSGSRTLLWVLIGGGGFFLFVMAVFTLVYLAVKSDGKSDFAGGFGDRVAVVELKGVILDAREFAEEMKKHGDDDSIKAIIVHIDSPGGGAEASQEMYQAVMRVREKKKKPVVAIISTVGASGGYYVAAATDKIIANNASIVGSIGVIAQWVNYGDLLAWAKLKDVTLKAGTLKDAGSPTREMTKEEREYLQGIIDNMHQQFIHDVAAGRKIKEEELLPLATGQVWTGQQAEPLKLIDKIGGFQTAVDEAAQMAKIKGEPTLVRKEREKRTLMDILFNDASDLIPDRARLMQKNIGFYYLWN